MADIVEIQMIYNDDVNGITRSKTFYFTTAQQALDTIRDNFDNIVHVCILPQVVCPNSLAYQEAENNEERPPDLFPNVDIIQINRDTIQPTQ